MEVQRQRDGETTGGGTPVFRDEGNQRDGDGEEAKANEERTVLDLLPSWRSDWSGLARHQLRQPATGMVNDDGRAGSQGPELEGQSKAPLCFRQCWQRRCSPHPSRSECPLMANWQSTVLPVHGRAGTKRQNLSTRDSRRPSITVATWS